MEMEILVAIGTVIVGGSTALLGYIFGHKKVAAEAIKLATEAKKVAADTKKTELDTVEQAVRIWRELTNGLQDELKLLKQEYIKISVDNKALADKYQSLSIKYASLKRDHDQLQVDFKALTIENQMLKNKLEQILGTTSSL